MVHIRARLAAAHAQHDEVRPGTVVFTSRRHLPGFRWLLVPLLFMLSPLAWNTETLAAGSSAVRRALAAPRLPWLLAAAALAFTLAVLVYACCAWAVAPTAASVAGGADSDGGEGSGAAAAV